MLEVKRMETDAEIQASFGVMSQLRPQLKEKNLLILFAISLKMVIN